MTTMWLSLMMFLQTKQTIKLTPMDLKNPTIIRHVNNIYTIQNPTKKNLTISINCGAQWKPFKVKLLPGLTDLEILEPNEEAAVFCYIDGNW